MVEDQIEKRKKLEKALEGYVLPGGHKAENPTELEKEIINRAMKGEEPMPR